MDYTETHRVLVTYLRGVKSVDADVLEHKFQQLAAALGVDGTQPASDLRAHLSAINVRLERLSFKVASIRDQHTDRVRYVFVNTRFDDAIQGCTAYSAPELDAVKQLVDNIVNAHNFAFCVAYVNAKQHSAAVLRSKASEADYFLRRLVDDGWLDVLDNSRVVLSAGALAELDDYLVDRFGVFSAADPSGKLLRCAVCAELVTVGARTSAYAFHHKCLALYTRNREVGPADLPPEDLDQTVPVGPR